MKKIKVGIISPNDKRPWCFRKNTASIVEKEKELAQALRKKGFEIIHGYSNRYSPEKTAWKTSLVRLQAAHLIDSGVNVILIHQGDWTFPTRTLEILSEVKRLAGEKPPGIAMFSYQDPKVPGLVAGMAARGACLRVGENLDHVFGKPNDEKVMSELAQVLIKNSNPSYDRKAALWRESPVISAVNREFLKEAEKWKPWAGRLKNKVLPLHKYLAFGGMSLDMTTTTADIDQWRMIFGVNYAHLDQIWIDKKADKLLRQKDPRIQRALENILANHNLSFAKNAATLKKKIVLQIASFYAMSDLIEEEEATFGGIKCQDEESALRCTQCMGAAYLNNDTGPDGEQKEIIPFACENDMDSALTQLLMFLATGKPAGFGDFRDIDERERLAIVNCGQHPPYYFDGVPEHLEQEHFYAKGGASVRGRTPAGRTLTVARLGRIGLKYTLMATVIETEKVEIDDHKKYNLSWPIILGRLPAGLSGKKMIDIWPCNHLGFVEGDITAKLAALADELKIGYRIIDKKGFEHYQKTRL